MRRRRSGNGVLCTPDRDEERVTLRVDFLVVVLLECRPQFRAEARPQAFESRTVGPYCLAVERGAEYEEEGAWSPLLFLSDLQSACLAP